MTPLVGHRKLGEQQDKVVEKCKEVLSTAIDAVQKIGASLANAYPACVSERPIVRIVSSLAEGADRALVKAALELKDTSKSQADCEINVVLPFEPNVYKQDFRDDDSKKEFDDLLKSSSATVVLAGDRSTKEHRLDAYEAASRLVVEHSDILVAILENYRKEVFGDSREQNRGGAVATALYALQTRVPVIFIDFCTDTPTVSIETSVDDTHGEPTMDPISQLGTILQNMLRLPERNENAGSEHKPYKHRRDVSFADYCNEKSKHWWQQLHYRFLWAVLMLVPWFRKRVEQKKTKRSRKKSAFDPYYRWAHELAVHYAILYRGAFLNNYMFGALAVTCAILACVSDKSALKWTLTEFGLLILIAANYLFERHYRWHERSVDYRILAEKFRLANVLHEVGLERPCSPSGLVRYLDSSETSWMNWYYRAVVRCKGVREGTMDIHHLNNCLKVLINWTSKQIRYHEVNARDMEWAGEVLRWCSLAMFALAGLTCAAHMANHFLYLGIPVPWLTVLAASLPATGAACHAALTQGEFERLAKRSNCMTDVLESIKSDLQAKASNPDLAYIWDMSSRIAQVTSDEVIDWRVLYITPSIHLG